MENYLFYEYEKEKVAKNEMMILCGETLQKASRGLYPAVVHRVAKCDVFERFSLVYLMRARPDAKLPAKNDDYYNSGENSAENSAEFEDSLSVAEFFREMYLKKKSANMEGGRGLPLANLKGQVLGQQELDEWAKQ